MASFLITSWQIAGEKVEEVKELTSLDSKITVNGDCGHEINIHLLPRRKAKTNLDKMIYQKAETAASKMNTTIMES